MTAPGRAPAPAAGGVAGVGAGAERGAGTGVRTGIESVPAAGAAGTGAVAEALLLPVGHLSGTFADMPGGGRRHEVRAGGRLHWLADGGYLVWLLAHGPTADGTPDGPPCTRAAVAARVREARVDGVAAVVDDLLSAGLLADVVVGSPEAERFARRHRLLPLLVGLGNSAADPDSYSIGLLDRPLLAVTRTVYDLWALGAADGTLWQACQAQSARMPAGQQADPHRLLSGLLTHLHLLVGMNAAYLEPVDGSGDD